LKLQFWKPKPAQRVALYQTAPLQIVIKRDPIDDALLCLAVAVLLAFLLPRLADALANPLADA